jgi:CRISPR-associated endonuclease/helicase Cas3
MQYEILEFWGKARSSDLEAAKYHPLAFHMLDVAACAEHLVAARPDGLRQVAMRFGISCADLEALAVRLVALHDIGKCAAGFQARVLDLWPNALGPRPSENSVASVRHDAAGLWLFTRKESVLHDIGKELLPGLCPSDRKKLLQAVFGHHGEPVNAANIQIGKKAQGAALELARAILRVLPVCKPLHIPDAAVAPLSFTLAGITILADWLGSNTLWFPYKISTSQSASLDDELKSYRDQFARPRAETAMREAGLKRVATVPFLGLSGLFPGISPTPLQSLAETLDLPKAGPILVIIEDMTGAGKTEAAVTLAHRLLASGRSRGVYVALPTMATANAMFERLSKSYRRMIPGNENPSLVLIHGKRNLVEGFASLPRKLGNDEGKPEDAMDADPSQVSASAFCADWIARSNKQAFLAQVGAGTIDQALLSILPARHQALRLFGITDKVLIIDEAHAYDAYMGKEIETLLRFHAGFGGSAIILSATLPREKRIAFANAFRKGLGGAAQQIELIASSYPLVTSVSRDAIQEMSCSLREGLSRTVKVLRATDVETAHIAVLDAARRGGAVALIRNTVDEAIASHAALAGTFGGETLLFHARFAMGDRLDVETRVLRKFGRKTAPEMTRGGILVATQVVEQSLDLDFDFLVTDLAPVDLLVQRAGRLWRHMDVRPANMRSMQAPEILVISADPVSTSNPNWLDTILPKTKFVYKEDAALLWRSAKILFDAGRIVSRTREEGEGDAPGEIRTLIEAVYGNARIKIPDEMKANENRAVGRNSADRSQAHYNALDFDKGYDLDGGRWESDTRIPTRLTDATTTLRLAVVVDGRVRPWAARNDTTNDERRDWALSEVTVSARRCAGVPRSSREVQTMLDAACRDWTISERDMPVLILSPCEAGPDLWHGIVLGKDGKGVGVFYSQSCGLKFKN